MAEHEIVIPERLPGSPWPETWVAGAEFKEKYSAAGRVWRIVQCLDKLKDKYGLNPVGPGASPVRLSFEFDAYVTQRVGAKDGWCDRLEASDVMMTHLMHSNILDENFSALMSPAMRAKIEMELRGLSETTDLLSDDAIPETAIRKLFEAACFFGVGLAKASKVLCQKRPRLIPMLDSYVMGFLFGEGRPKDVLPADAAIAGMKKIRLLVDYADNRRALDAVTSELNRALTSAAGPSAPQVGVLRVLESLLWFDWEGWRVDWGRGPGSWVISGASVVRRP